MVQPKAAFAWFDLFRFIGAILVVLEHTRDLIWVDAAEAAGVGLFYQAAYFGTGLGRDSLMVFFILSGFWISATVDRRLPNENFWGDYLVDRLSRLLVVLIPALCLGGLLDLIGIASGLAPYFGDVPARTVPEDIANRLSLGIFIGNVVFLQGLALPTFGSNGSLWSLAYEFWFYMWYPAVVVLLFRRKLNWGLLSLAVCFLWPEMLPGLGVWLIGSVLYHLHKHVIAEATWSRAARIAFFTVALVLFAVAATISRIGGLPFALADLALGVSFGALAAGFLLLNPAMPGWLAPGARYGAEASYSLYVTHFPLVLLLSSALFGVQRAVPDAAAIGQLLFLVALAIPVGWLFSRATEAHTRSVRLWAGARLGRGAKGIKVDRAKERES